MFRILILVLFSYVSLFALSDSETLRRANKFMNIGTTTNVFRAYNDYKNLYLRAIIKNDDRLKKNALVGIVKSGKRLHIDILQYEDELFEITKNSKSKYIRPKKDKKKIKITTTNKLKYIGFQNNKLVLKFNKKINNKQINYFKIYDSSNQRYRYVFDIHASMLNSSQYLRKKCIKKIKIAQYKPNTIRLVIENNSRIELHFKKQNNKLIVSIGNENKSSYKKTTYSKKISKVPTRKDRKKIIVLDAGHGGKDPGAVGYKHYREKIVVLQVANEVYKILKNRGYKVYRTRSKDYFVTLVNRTKLANKKNADLFISIHANSALKNSAHGVECYFLSKSRSKRASRVAAKENAVDKCYE